MPIVKGRNSESEFVIEASKLMLISARTSPKAGGEDDVLTALIYGDEKDVLAREMDKMADEKGVDDFRRDAGNVRNSDVVVLVGVRGTSKYGHRLKRKPLNCGACGFPTCDEFEKAEKKFGEDFAGPTCLLKALDLGIALGSAVKTASILNIDSRVMLRVGTAAMRLKILPEASVIVGVPASAAGKSIYFDRKT